MTLELLDRRIKTTHDLKGIVSMMKMLSSVSVGQYEKALRSLNAYEETIYDAFVGLFHDGSFQIPIRPKLPESPKVIAILVGTDNGLVGKLNQDVLAYARKYLSKKEDGAQASYLCVGRKMGMLASFYELPTVATYPISNSLKEIASVSSLLLVQINQIISQKEINQVLVFNMHRTRARQTPVAKQLIPLPYHHLKNIRSRKWSGRTLPWVAADRNALFSALAHEYLTALLSETLTAALACEHYMRMMHMQQAEKNIDESLEVLNLEYQQLRQAKITDELIDIIAGTESIPSAKKRFLPLTKDSKKARIAS